ncbi:peptide chain release factor 1 [Actinoplanes sp. SE50]|uniref:baeRF2 domain-containing protein n=1 Tax=unclassified Actinoplanes TaxID=2626549 RepID=UPI00023ED486|nr:MULTISPECIES: Vms1/Ankzf1 family peptidyl-tRNA hydrolase [unclassified Actinoplanes]AEV85630.1 Eukaryotic peptide chain release factor subunit 1 [Actinoplanes sp. SE50/110]ATO84023.1 peptide chain release factor 1 [Actinoplanes sp. SE50]SLM01433.1 peptide chain release factor 1 [Actinoplanes sp. SE50/110]
MKLDFVRPLVDRTGSWVSVYLDATRAGENADHEVGLRWRALRERLTGDGADSATLDAVEAAVKDHPYQPGRYGLAVFARDGEVAMVETTPAPPPVDEAVTGALPHLMPLIAQRGEQIPYVRVLTDRTGADLDALSVGGATRHREVTGGATFPLRKVQAGGWSHRRYHQAAEESWKRNAGDVAAAAADLADSAGAEVIVVGGDVRAVQTFAGRLPRRWQDRVVRTDAGSRHAGADESPLDDVTIQAIAEVADRHTREAVDRYLAQRGDGTAGAGLTDVVTRLQRGQVDTVLLVDDASSTDTVWVSPDDPTLISVDDHPLREAGVPSPQRVRADAGLLRAIAATGADLVLVAPEEVALEHGIGAVLRYADAGSAAR